MARFKSAYGELKLTWNCRKCKITHTTDDLFIECKRESYALNEDQREHHFLMLCSKCNKFYNVEVI